MAGADFAVFYRANYARLGGQMVAVVGDVVTALRRLPMRQREVLVLCRTRRAGRQPA